MNWHNLQIQKRSYAHEFIRYPTIVKQHDGSIVLIAVLMLLAISIFGIVSLNTSAVELYIARNERDLREILYLAESAAMEGVQRLLDTKTIDLEETHLFWHHSITDLADMEIDFRNPAHWKLNGDAEDNGCPSSISPHTYMAAVEWDVATGGSLVVTESRLYVNRIYGLCRKNGADDIVEIGYRLRY